MAFLVHAFVSLVTSPERPQQGESDVSFALDITPDGQRNMLLWYVGTTASPVSCYFFLRD